MTAFDLILSGGKAVVQGEITEVDIGITNGHIASIGSLQGEATDKRFDAKGLHILPGVIDSHVHFRQPGGAEDQEDFCSGTLAAALGGVSTVLDMPNTNPPTVSAETLADKLSMAEGSSWCDFGFYIGATRENIDELPMLERQAGCCGVKLFMGSSTGSLLIDDDATIKRVLENGSAVVAVHSEDEPHLVQRIEEHRIEGDVSSHSRWRSSEVARKSTERIVALAAETGRRVHILHISTAEEISILSNAPANVSFEVTPHHLFLDADNAYATHGAFVQVNPPLRTQLHIKRLWQAVSSGLAATIGSDHAPHSITNKLQPYPKSPSGLPGSQTMLPLLLNAVNDQWLSLPRLSELLCSGPAKVYAMHQKGRIEVGADADFTLVDMEATRQVDGSWLASKCGWSPYEGMQLRGWPVGTVVRGNFTVFEGEVMQQVGSAVDFARSSAE